MEVNNNDLKEHMNEEVGQNRNMLSKIVHGGQVNYNRFLKSPG